MYLRQNRDEWLDYCAHGTETWGFIKESNFF
jgi:hypothetical protein